MDRVNKRQLFAGVVISILGSDAIISLASYFRSGGVFLLFLGIILIVHSHTVWRDDFVDNVPQKFEDLFYYPTFPYFQTFLVFLLFLGALFYLDDYMGIIFVLIGLVVSQFPLIYSKKYLKDRSKVFLVIEFQLFLFFSTFLYLQAESLFLFRSLPGILPSAFFVGAWTFEMVRLYVIHVGRYTGE